jgi:hypothetical protein
MLGLPNPGVWGHNLPEFCLRQNSKLKPRSGLSRGRQHCWPRLPLLMGTAEAGGKQGMVADIRSLNLFVCLCYSGGIRVLAVMADRGLRREF